MRCFNPQGKHFCSHVKTPLRRRSMGGRVGACGGAVTPSCRRGRGLSNAAAVAPRGRCSREGDARSRGHALPPSGGTEGAERRWAVARGSPPVPGHPRGLSWRARRGPGRRRVPFTAAPRRPARWRGGAPCSGAGSARRLAFCLGCLGIFLPERKHPFCSASTLTSCLALV